MINNSLIACFASSPESKLRCEDAIIEGSQRVCAKAGAAPHGIGQIVHGTTLATNALIERRGAKTALITTRSFCDVIEMRAGSRFEQYDLNLVLPEPLLPRHRRDMVTERRDADGNVLIALDEAEVGALALTLPVAFACRNRAFLHLPATRHLFARYEVFLGSGYAFPCDAGVLSGSRCS